MGLRLTAVVAVATLIGLTAGCTEQRSADGHGHETATVVASTDVWGSVAEAVVGDHATVESILISAVNDPHSFEASPAAAAEIADATLVVYNGGGYDRWVDEVLATTPNVPAVDAYSLLPAIGGATNEHVFYDLPTAKAVATQVAERLAAIDTDHAQEFRANAARFGEKVEEILTAERAIGQHHSGAAVVATEPVAYYLVRNAGLTDRTPEGFAGAIEEDTDPSPADLAKVLDLITGGEVSALLYNPQTQTPVTKKVHEAATQAGVPVVVVTEGLPEDTDYLTWQRQTVERLAGALDKSPRPDR
ncbi:metal ABC transporter solute-binding protein, Zn/Mn family [Mycolicibacterium sp. XJ1819]